MGSRSGAKMAIVVVLAGVALRAHDQPYVDSFVSAITPRQVWVLPGQPFTYPIQISPVTGSGINVGILSASASGLSVSTTGIPFFNIPGIVNIKIAPSPPTNTVMTYQLVSGFLGGADNSPVALPSTKVFVTYLTIDATNGDFFGDPVSTATGELYDSAIPPDLSLGGPLPLEFRRYYSSLILSNGLSTRIGNNWMHNFEWLLTLTNDQAIVTRVGARTITFNKTGTASAPTWTLANPDQYGYQLVTGANSTYQFLDPRTNHIYMFSGTGTTLGNTAIQDRNGNTLTIALPSNGSSQVSDGLGRILTITYDSNGKLVKVADQTSRSISFGYTGNDLTQFTDANGKIQTYSYTTAGNVVGLMTSATLPLGNKPFTQTWDSFGRVSSQADSRGNIATMTYEQPVGSAAYKDALGSLMTDTSQNYSDFLTYKDPDNQVLSATYDANSRRNSVTDRLGNKISMTYHSPSGYLATVTDALGNTTTNTWQAQVSGPFTFYVLTKTQYADGSLVSFTYDASGNVLTATDKAGKISKATYNARGQILTATDAVGRVTTTAYNTDATVTSITDPAGNATTYIYDAQKRVTQIKFADGTTRSILYDNLDHVLTTVNERGRTTGLAFNANEKLQGATDALGKSVAFAYDTDEHVTKTTDRNTQSATFAYNELGLNKSVTTPAGETFTSVFDTHRRLSKSLDPSGSGFTFGYDKEDGLTSVTDALSRKSAITLDKDGLSTRLTTPSGANYFFNRDKLERYTGGSDPANVLTAIGYDGRGSVNYFAIGSFPEGSPTLLFNYNDAGQLTGVVDPLSNTWAFGYDAAGRLSSRTDPLKRATTYSFDKRNRVAGATMPIGTAALTYDATGNLVRRLYSDGTDLNYTYDDNNRLTGGTGLAFNYDAEDRLTGSNGLVVARDANGRISSITYGTGKTVKYAYNSVGLLASVTDWVSGSTTFTYDAAHQLTAMKRPNGSGTQYTYDADGRLASITEDAGSSVVVKRDAAGKTLSDTRTQPASAPAAPAMASGILPLTYDVAHQVSAFTYDAMGRITADALRKYVWDLGSRLTSYAGSGGAATATYDGNGLRMSLTSSSGARNFVWNYATGLPSIATVQDTSGDRRYYVYMPGGTLLYAIDASNNARHFYHFDENGSTVLLTNDSGAITDSYAISPYGETVTQTGSTENPFTWLGQIGVMQEGSTGLYYMRARYYDSATARFLSKDPIFSVNPLSVNPYQYALANPIGVVDPNGLAPGFDIRTQTEYGTLRAYYPQGHIPSATQLAPYEVLWADPFSLEDANVPIAYVPNIAQNLPAPVFRGGVPIPSSPDWDWDKIAEVAATLTRDSAGGSGIPFAVYPVITHYNKPWWLTGVGTFPGVAGSVPGIAQFGTPGDRAFIQFGGFTFGRVRGYTNPQQSGDYSWYHSPGSRPVRDVVFGNGLPPDPGSINWEGPQRYVPGEETFPPDPFRLHKN